MEYLLKSRSLGSAARGSVLVYLRAQEVFEGSAENMKPKNNAFKACEFPEAVKEAMALVYGLYTGG